MLATIMELLLDGIFSRMLYYCSYANRIAKGHFSLEGKEYSLAINNGNNSLHGGNVGWSRVPFSYTFDNQKLWEYEKCETDSAIGVIFSIVSPDGDEGYPGEVTVLFLKID